AHGTSGADALSLLASGPADDAALALPGAGARLALMLENAFAQGAAGLAADILGYCLQPWGFEPEAVQAKTLLLYGSADPVGRPTPRKLVAETASKRPPGGRPERWASANPLDVGPRVVAPGVRRYAVASIASVNCQLSVISTDN